MLIATDNKNLHVMELDKAHSLALIRLLHLGTTEEMLAHYMTSKEWVSMRELYGMMTKKFKEVYDELPR